MDMKIGEKIKFRRRRLLMNQYDLAKRVGTHQKIISDIETGKRLPRLDEIPRLAEALEVPQSWFLEEEEDESSDNFSGISTNFKSTTTEIDNVDVLLREVSKMTPEQRQEFWDGILKIVEVVVQTRFKQEKSKNKDKTVLVLE